MDEISDSTWDAIHRGNRMVVENLSSFDDFDTLEVAGKTGTAQQVTSRPNHALFVGYAPYEDPQISIATRIAYGYSSHNAADVSADILKYYFNLESANHLITGTAAKCWNKHKFIYGLGFLEVYYKKRSTCGTCKNSLLS